jgi:glycosyltransferase involved in cell wall biosynthesis
LKAGTRAAWQYPATDAVVKLIDVPSFPISDVASPACGLASILALCGQPVAGVFAGRAEILMKVSVVLPVYNEISYIDEILRRTRASPVEKEIIVVDDCSTDGTRARLEEIARQSADHSVRVFFHDVNRGKGAALRTGFAAVTGDIVIIQDADLEYDPAEYPKLIAPILEGKADVVYGSRFIGGDSHRVLYFWHSVANRFLTLLSNMFTNLNLTDMETCYKVFRREVIQSVKLTEDRFGFEPEVTARVAAMKCRVYEVGISYSGRTYEEGKKIGWKDGVRTLWCVLKHNLLH